MKFAKGIVDLSYELHDWELAEICATQTIVYLTTCMIEM